MKKRVLFLVKLAVGVIMLLVLIRTVDADKIITAFRQPDDMIFIYAAIFLVIPNLFFQWHRWHILLQLNSIRVSRWDTFCSLLGGMMLGFATPGRIGEAGRALFIPGGDRMQILGLLVIDKLYSFTCIVIGGVWGMLLILFRKFSYESFIVYPAVLFGLLITLLAVGLALHPGWIRTMVYNFSLILPYRDKLKNLMSGFDCLDRKQSLHFLILSSILYIVFILQFCLLARAFQPLSLEAAFSSTTAAMLAKTLLPISLADLGVREGASMFFFLQYNIQKVTGFNSALLLFSINVLFPALLGLFTLPRMGRITKISKSKPVD